MATDIKRRKLIVTTESSTKATEDKELNSNIEKYCEQKNQESVLSKSNKQLAENIKQALIGGSKTDMSTGKYSVHLVTKVTESLDEVKMLAVLKDYWQKNKGEEKCPFICTAEYINMDELEAFMYKEELPQETMLALDSCRIKKESTALTYKIAKGETDDKKND